MSSDFAGTVADAISSEAVEVLEDKGKAAENRAEDAGGVATHEIRFITKAGALGPVDVDFFKTFRLRVGADKLTNAYTGHPWAYAGLNRIATDASSVPFVIITEAPEGEVDDSGMLLKGEAAAKPKTPLTRAAKRAAKREAHKARKEWFQELAKFAPGIPRWLHDAYEDASPRKYFRELRRRSPQSSPYLCAKAAGVVIVEEGPWADLFESPNPNMTRSQLWESTAVYLGTGGVCYWILEGKGDSLGTDEVPVEIWPTSKDGWEPIIGKQSGLIEKWKRTTRKNGKKEERTFELHEVIQFRYFHPERDADGLSPLTPAMLEIKQDHKASLFNNSFFEHGAQLGGVLTSEQPLTPAQTKEVREQFEARHGGVTQSFKTAVLTGGLKFTETGVRQRDMQFAQLRTMSRDVILAVLGVPKSEVGIIEDVNRSTAQVSKRTMWIDTLLPKLSYIEDLLWGQLFKRLTNGKFWGLFDLSNVEALRDDLDMKADVLVKLAEKGYPVNVLAQRLELGLPSLEWGNVWWAQSSLTPVFGDPEEEPDEPPPPPPGAPPPDEEPPDEDDPDADNPDEDDPDDEGNDPGDASRIELLEGTDDDEDPDEVFSDLDGLLEDGAISQEQYDHAEACCSRVYEDLPDDFETGSPEWERIEAKLLTPGERKIRKAVATNIFHIRRKQMQLLNQAPVEDDEPLANAITLPEQVLFMADEFKDRISRVAAPIYARIYDDSLEDARAELDAAGFEELSLEDLERRALEDDAVPDQIPLEGPSAIRRAVLAVQDGRIRSTVLTIRHNIRTAVLTAIESGLTKNDARKLIRRAFGMMRSKPRTIGVTETASLVNGGRHQVFLERGIEQVEWITAGDELVRREHVVFGRAGARPRGHNWAEELGLGPVFTIVRPLDPRAPARLVINCRCVLIPSTAQGIPGA